MFEENTPLVRELSLVFLLLCLLLFIPGKAFFPLLPVIPIVFFAGLTWSVLGKWNTRLGETIITNIGAIGIFVWFVYALSHSYFGYKEVLLILLKSVIFLITVFCFCASTPRYRTYIVFLSTLLCVGAVLYSQHSTILSGVCLLGVFFCWLVLMKVRFVQVFSFTASNSQQWWRFLVIPGIIFAAVVLCASFVIFVLRTPYLKKVGFFDSADLADTGELEALEKEYYFAQDAFQGQASQLALNSDVSDDRHSMMKMVSIMVNEEHSEVQEVEQAEQGLKSLLRTPGLGDEKGKGDEITHALDHYAEIKSTINVMHQSDKIMQKVRDQGVDFFKGVSMLVSLGAMRFSSSRKDITAASKRLDNNIDALGASESRQTDLKEQAKDLKQWRVFWSFLKQIRLLKAQLDSASVSIQSDFIKAISRIEDIQTVEDVRVALKEVARLKQEYPAAQNYSRKLDEIMSLRLEMFLAQKEHELMAKLEEAGASPNTLGQVRKNLEELLKAPSLKPESRRGEDIIIAQTDKLAAQIQKAAAEAEIPEKIGSQLLNETQGLKNVLMSEAKKEQVRVKRLLKLEEAKKLQAKAPFPLRKIILLVLGILLFLLCVFSGFFIYRLFMTLRARGKLVSDYANPRSFIVNLYANMQRIITVFGMRQQEELPPLLCASYIGGKYGISVNDFVVFSKKFEEARYSQHVLTLEDASGALKAYNSFLDILLQQVKILKRFQRIFFSVLGGIPLKIIHA